MKVQEGECLWRPYLTGIVFLAQNLAQKYFRKYPDSFGEYTTVDGIKVYEVKDSEKVDIDKCGKITENGVLMEYLGYLEASTLIIPCSNAFWGSSKRGEGPRYDALRFEWGMYLEEGKEIIHRATFYLPWRSGAKLDYSDYGKVFKIVPQLLYKMLQDGLDSGTSTEIRGSFVGRLGVAKEQKQEEKAKEEVVFV